MLLQGQISPLPTLNRDKLNISYQCINISINLIKFTTQGELMIKSIEQTPKFS